MKKAPVSSLSRALKVLTLFHAHAPEWSVTSAARELGYSKANVSKVMATYEIHGILRKDPVTRRYQLGPALAALVPLALANLEVRQLARPALRKLAEQTGETALLVVRSGWHSVCIEKAESSSAVRMAADIGMVGSLHMGGSSRPLLLDLTPEELEEYLREVPRQRRTPTTPVTRDEILATIAAMREQGVAFSLGEVESGVGAIGAPVMDAHGRVAAAISIAGPLARIQTTGVERISALVKEHAETLSRQLAGGWLVAAQAARQSGGV